MKPLDLRIGVIGMGAIGSSLSALFTGNGYETSVVDIRPEADFYNAYDTIYDDLEKRNLITGSQREICRKLVSYSTDYAILADADLVIECVFENLEEKFRVYKKLEAICDKLRVLASSTSVIMPEDLQKGVKRWPGKVLVAHPFNPPHLVPFLEIVKTSDTEPQAVELTRDFFVSCGRMVCLMKKSAPGFIANRLHHALLREAIYMVEQGLADPKEIERTMAYSFIPRYNSIGIFEHHDGYSLDQLQNLQDYLYPYLGASKKAPDLVVNKVKAGDLGMKSGRGFYDWNEESIADFKKRAAEPYWRFFNWNLPRP
ncbi:MAG: 3-hydroxyacyl-CoA dehydrogenase family protein [Treponema sp.]|jgi:3-hydroxybutyryl-CoA dehydrogenase|nr:3-hydroxyacyl-CoA dehydrogenase family protein [Treponema sp.]